MDPYPWLYQKLAWPFMQGSPGCVAFTQPSPTALALQPSVFASQLTSWASTAFLEVGNVMQPCAATVATHSAADPTRSIIIIALDLRYDQLELLDEPPLPAAAADLFFLQEMLYELLYKPP